MKVPLYKKIARVAAVLVPLLVLAFAFHNSNKAEDDMIRIHAAYGEEKYMLLPDSTEIWLNAGTTITYLPDLAGEERMVHLDGEAYFSVKKDESRPFIVHTDRLTVKVLGTRFNVKAYAGDEKTVATLASGRVEVITSANQKRILKPNERLSFHNHSSLLELSEISPDEANGWMNGQLIFVDASIKDIVRTLERRFDIPITDNTGIPASKLYTVKFLKGEGVEEILYILGETAGFITVEKSGSIELIKN